MTEEVMTPEVMNDFSSKLTQKVGKKFVLRWDKDKKGVVCGWCSLTDPDDIYPVAKLIAGYKGRVMTISPLNTPSALVDELLGKEQSDAPAEEKAVKVIINYHFYFNRINLTAAITLPDNLRTVKSITPVLKSADWHEREMQELFNIKLQGHPNSKRLFLDKDIHMTDHTMIPLSEALNGASTNTLWEKIMRSDRKDADASEQL